MIPGQIYKWQTEKVRGRERRVKYHLYIGADDKGMEVFLFINSENYYNEGFELKRSEYPFFSKESSYIGCTSAVRYKNSEISHLREEDFLGIISETSKRELIKHIEQSEVLESGIIKFICTALSNQT